ncbi:thioesterase superfamily protein [Leptonema illini DSM 21528]|jgi:acyl-CoA thioester hydrolase|uniref:Thioesterase superfamily protein n=2 Tax=Leptonema illini TaxID=183 RepID=H2CD18_9LEPT|nr:thioesterase family protein [Leptonema illini]EHQ07494.1 thioesterase superfamily protein [Leptonema illini DSM 21528]
MEKNRSPATRFRRYPFEHKQYVAWGDMDAFSHLNNVVYVRYFENARVEFFRRLGVWSNEPGPEHGPVIVNLAMQYRKQVRYPAELSITLGVSRLKTRTFSFVCAMFDGTGECVHTAEADFMWIHFEKATPISVPDEVIRAFEAYRV